MIIDGFEKLTLLDYPGCIACIIFTRGCNYSCSYCQNSSLINNIKKPGKITEDEVINFLMQRKGKLEGIVISGGEPTIQKDLKSFIEKIKKIGFKVKLDTNGSNPKLLQELIDERLVDYVAMDIKNDLDNYEEVTKCKVNKNSIKESISILLKGKVDYEFRTTIIKDYHKIDNIKNIIKLINGCKKYYIQNFKLSSDVIDKGLSGFSLDELKLLQEKLNFKNMIIRSL